MEAMISEMRRVMKLELEQVHERIDQMESAHGKLQNASNVHRRERVQPGEMRVEDEEPYGTGFDEEDDRDSVVVMAFPNTSNAMNPTISHQRWSCPKMIKLKVVFATHSPDPSTGSDFEDGEVCASTPIATMRDSLSRLTWLTKRAIENSSQRKPLTWKKNMVDSRLTKISYFVQTTISMVIPTIEVAKRGGPSRGKFHTRAKLASTQKSYLSRHNSSAESRLAQAQFNCFDKAYPSKPMVALLASAPPVAVAFQHHM
ncbi:hypothetical protein F0562_025469 [Nyssa sinensis]|uniref:Uncharacterized protein n=1 Tax=Nyssa sinensis TaxID=561372 RepID=A0A5J5BAI8_9ASTE|nr:hypothetical protein F0562_025469 [Nyssa sinensis]